MRLHRLTDKADGETSRTEGFEDDGFGTVQALFTMGKGIKNKETFAAYFEWKDVEILIETFGKMGVRQASDLLRSRQLATIVSDFMKASPNLRA